jgi:hypothetical protein
MTGPPSTAVLAVGSTTDDAARLRALGLCGAAASVVAGAGAIRAGLFDGAARWLVLALGAYVFVVRFPAVFGPTVAGRLTIAVWLLGFAALGLTQAREGRP